MEKTDDLQQLAGPYRALAEWCRLTAALISAGGDEDLFDAAACPEQAQMVAISREQLLDAVRRLPKAISTVQLMDGPGAALARCMEGFHQLNQQLEETFLLRQQLRESASAELAAFVSALGNGELP